MIYFRFFLVLIYNFVGFRDLFGDLIIFLFLRILFLVIRLFLDSVVFIVYFLLKFREYEEILNGLYGW